MPGPADVVLIAGKGRHAYQIFADSVVPFDDHAVARHWLRAHSPRHDSSIRLDRVVTVSCSLLLNNILRR